jgi:uncharacterized protein
MNKQFLMELLRAHLPWNTLWQHNVGARYATGEGVAKNEKKAVKWYRRAARRGDPESQYDLGLMILYGDGTPPNPKAAIFWLESAAELGHMDAAVILAEYFEKGLCGIPKDLDRARRWQQKSQK